MLQDYSFPHLQDVQGSETSLPLRQGARLGAPVPAPSPGGPQLPGPCAWLLGPLCLYFLLIFPRRQLSLGARGMSAHSELQLGWQTPGVDRPGRGVTSEFFLQSAHPAPLHCGRVASTRVAGMHLASTALVGICFLHAGHRVTRDSLCESEAFGWGAGSR